MSAHSKVPAQEQNRDEEVEPGIAECFVDRSCARVRCDAEGTVAVTPNAMVLYCVNCAPIVACHRARLIRAHEASAKGQPQDWDEILARVGE
jgi:hypothetical protein